jgi:glycosyltransferase involved in cell wall biosynthesis
MTTATDGPVSVVIPACDEGDNLVDTVDCVLRNSGCGDRLEVVVVDDGSTDGAPERALAQHRDDRLRVIRGGGLGVAGARNRGAAAAHGSVLVFLDAHCFVPPGWLVPLVDACLGDGVGLAGPAFSDISSPGMRACGITWGDADLENVWLPCPPEPWPAPVPFHIGACQAVRADAFRDVGCFDAGMGRWGSEDIELCLRMWLLGYAVVGEPRSLVYHLFRRSHPYEVDAAQVVFNKLRMVVAHFDEARLAAVLGHMRHHYGLESGLARALTDDTGETRRSLLARRVHDMDWLCRLFGIPL